MSHRSESNLGGNVPTAIGESEATRQLEGPPVYAHATLDSSKGRGALGLAATSVHPVAIQIGLGAVTWFLAVAWLYFAWGRHVDFDLAIATGFFVMFFTLFLRVASMAINDPRWLERKVSFPEFLQSRVTTATGDMRGWDVLIEISLVPVSLALAATLIGLAWLLLR
jgi:hypothetical protein